MFIMNLLSLLINYPYDTSVMDTKQVEQYRAYFQYSLSNRCLNLLEALFTTSCDANEVGYLRELFVSCLEQSKGVDRSLSLQSASIVDHIMEFWYLSDNTALAVRIAECITSDYQPMLDGLEACLLTTEYFTEAKDPEQLEYYKSLLAFVYRVCVLLGTRIQDDNEKERLVLILQRYMCPTVQLPAMLELMPVFVDYHVKVIDLLEKIAQYGDSSKIIDYLRDLVHMAIGYNCYSPEFLLCAGELPSNKRQPLTYLLLNRIVKCVGFNSLTTIIFTYFDQLLKRIRKNYTANDMSRINETAYSLASILHLGDNSQPDTAQVIRDLTKSLAALGGKSAAFDNITLPQYFLSAGPYLEQQ